MNTPPWKNNIKTVLELDLASYSNIARALEENLDVYAVKAFEDQVQSFVDHGLDQVGLKREDIVLGSAGDNAILVFNDPAVMHRFSEAVQQSVAAHNYQKTVESAKRWFRMGAATGPVLLLQAERRIVGTTVARAVRLEAAAKNGQLLADVATYDSLPNGLKACYGEEEEISGKRDERFIARRCTFVPTDEASWVRQTAKRPLRWTAVAVLCLVCGILATFFAFNRENQNATHVQNSSSGTERPDAKPAGETTAQPIVRKKDKHEAEERLRFANRTKADEQEIQVRITKNANEMGEIAVRTLLPNAQPGRSVVQSTKVSKDGKAVEVVIRVEYESTFGKQGTALTFKVDANNLSALAIRDPRSVLRATSDDLRRVETRLQELWRRSR